MSRIERYLDDMFDRLGGLGPAGRRALAETEDHLRAAVADEVAKGVPEEQAEQEAVRRFGAPATVARQIRRANEGSAPRFSSTWLMIGLTFVILALGYLSDAAQRVIQLQRHPEPLPACPTDSTSGFEGPCSITASTTRADALAGVALLLVGIAVLVGRRLAMRYRGLAPAGRLFPLFAAVLFLLATVIHPFITLPLSWLISLPFGSSPMMPHYTTLVLLLAAIVATVYGVVRYRRLART